MLGESLGWIRIPKCASRSVGTYLRRHGWRSHTSTLPDDRPYFVIVRHPWGRWKAACWTMCDALGLSPEEYLERICAHKGGLWTNDDNPHFVPQVSFIPDHLSDITFIPLPAIAVRVPAFIGSDRPLPHLNARPVGFELPARYFDAVCEHYAADLELYGKND